MKGFLGSLTQKKSSMTKDNTSANDSTTRKAPKKEYDIKDILLKEDGSINEDGINQYIAANESVDAYYENPESKFQGQTLLCAAITHDEISPHTKIRLASYLIKKGASVDRVAMLMGELTLKHDELIELALEEKDYEAAYLLLKQGTNVFGSFYDAYAGKNLIDVALDRKNEELLSWILKNAPSLFSQLLTDKFNSYYKRIIQCFPNFESSENYAILKQIAEERIARLFTSLGLIQGDDIALILAAKMSKKPYENSVFVIKKGDNLSLLTAQIKKILETETSENVIRFRIVYYQGHGCYGEFEIDKTTNPPTLRYAHIDPFPQLIKYTVIITNDFVREISPLANIEIGESDLLIQKGASCTYFSTDGAMALATPADRDYVPNVMAHMKKNGTKMHHSFEQKNVSYVRSPTLPARLMVGSHHLEDDPDEPNRRGLSSLIFNSPEKKTVVNKNRETAEAAAKKDITGHSSTSNQSVTRQWNMRIERKMKQFGKAVHDFIKDNNINVFEPSFSSLLEEYSLQGLLQFCQKKLDARCDTSNANSINI